MTLNPTDTVELIAQGYRLLLTGDVVRAGDEQLRGHDNEWVPTTFEGWPIRDNKRWLPPIRRKIEADPQTSKITVELWGATGWPVPINGQGEIIVAKIMRRVRARRAANARHTKAATERAWAYVQPE